MTIKLLKTATAFALIAIIGAILGEATDSTIAQIVFMVAAFAALNI